VDVAHVPREWLGSHMGLRGGRLHPSDTVNPLLAAARSGVQYAGGTAPRYPSCGCPRLLKGLAELHGTFGCLQGVTIMTGGSAPTASLIEQLESLGVNLIHQYGLNETCGPFVVCESQPDWDHLPSRVKLRTRQGVPAIHVGTGL